MALGRKHLSFIVVPILLLAETDTAQMSNSWDQGAAAGNTQRNYVTGDLSGKINNPATSKSSFQTQSGTSFSANIQCKDANNVWATISYSGSDTITISATSGLSLSVSGIDTVCTNGFMKGSSTYRFTYASGLSYSSIDRSQLGGCYCITSSCGGVAASQKSRVLDTIGGAIIQAISSSIKTTSVKNTGSSFQIYKEDPNCSNSTGSLPDSSMNYDTEMVNQMGDSSSPYSAVTTGAANYSTSPASTEDTSAMKEVSRESSSSASYEPGTMTVTYNRKYVGEDNNWHQVDNEDAVIYNKATDEQKFCEVGFDSTNPSTFTDGTNRSGTAGGSTQKETEIRECTGVNHDVCPVESGEHIVHDCGNINDFAKVLGAFAALEEMTKDLICGN